MAEDAEQDVAEDAGSVADFVVRHLTAWRVDRIFGYSGDGINPLLGALRRAGKPAFIQARHEEAAAFMAVAHAKYTGRVGVVTATQGPGAVHLLNGLYDARMDSVPVVAVIGQQSRTVLGSGYQQEIDLHSLFKDVASAFLQQVSDPEQLPLVLDRAFKAALATRSPAVVILPHDVQQAPAPETPHEHGVVPSSPVWSLGTVAPREGDLHDAAALLNGGQKVALLVGQGAAHAQQEVVAIAERLGAGITTSLLGKPFVDESLPYATGTMGHLGTTASAHLMDTCDTLLIIGSNDPWTEYYPAPGQARAVQIDIDPKAIGNRYPVEVALHGDAAATLSSLLVLLHRQQDHSYRTEVEEQVDRWHRIAAERAMTPAEPVNPERVVHELNAVLPHDAQVAVDVGSCVYWYARQLRLPRGVPAHLSSTLGCMGAGVPYGIAAKLARPERPVVVLAGDGAMQMAGLAELVTVARLWQGWTDPRFIVCVLSNQDLAEVSWEQREMEGEPRFGDSQALPDVDIAAYARLLGLEGVRIEDPDDLADAWRRALAADRPFILDVVTDPNVPLLPPFPAGAAKLEAMQEALAVERNSSGAELLRRYAHIEDGKGSLPTEH
ncbi:thiamine pyrophosphate-requiring protein [Arthrobacter cheniae]|uniref:Thiamine pyrophosphate-requiring protein n=1 Tax=Arthrobacter cheniae TaxID=1258888 RepID=A0A3A5M7T7_9MICC|nr:thiamine pyrophosphate-requiring protein [Arthrobacter cheniae]RJT77262.1 thiamine pyrophosphate-requiring protein [Arthrobacter cheniae]